MINPITVDNFAALLNCTQVDRASDSMMVFHFSWLRPELFSLLLIERGSTDDLLLLQIFSGAVQGSRTVTQHIVSVESSSLLHYSIES